MRRRLPAVIGTLALAGTIAATLLYFFGPIANDKTAGVALHSYSGAGEFTSEPATGDDGADDPSIVLAQIPTPPTQVSNVQFSVWFESDKSRFEITRTAGGQSSTQTVVSDGKHDWSYDSISHTYASQLAETIGSDQDTRSVLAPGIVFSSVKDVLAKLDSSGDQKARIVGTENVLGRSAYVIEVSAADSQDAEATRPPSPGHSSTRIYLDKKYLFMLAWDQTTISGATYGIHMTHVSFNEDIDEGVFAFTPPPGAREVSSGELNGNRLAPGGGSSRGGDLGKQVNLPAGMLAPTFFLPDFQTRDVSESHQAGTSYRAAFLIQQDVGDGYISVEERRDVDAVPAELRIGDAVTAHGQRAWLLEDDGLLHLAWQEGDLVVYMISRGLSRDDLLHVAGSMEVSTNEPPGPTIVTPSP